ncbi:hypothetical protein GCM10007962_26260 [Yeosuana aromativorans]|uniref:Glycosyltransferase 2-like domain-containing protein n=1 Tax=Yeosuana aromativorans TaxID=288019 RepID=A0A8J3BQC8_9FLAO|nr:glycosyltransferase family 2 protein [Yeosuana aromativorans]GGK30669.1 hypothetical protein GCM10007962_26260 [Yeosuana aromativorans]
MSLKLIKDKNKPLVSIITTTFNSELTIKDTLESILKQTYNNIEYIIIDGMSEDKTVSIINSYKSKITERGFVFKLISEKDKGIADAWNKGLKLSTGDVIGLLNSDDWYDESAIEKAVSCLDINKPELSYGICKRVNNSKEVIEVINHTFKPQRIYLNFGFSHTTCFATKKLYDLIGVFKLDYKIALDTDFLLRCYKKGIIFKKCNNITYMRLGGVSTKHKMTAHYEHQKALKVNGFNPILVFFFGLLKKWMLQLSNNR